MQSVTTNLVEALSDEETCPLCGDFYPAAEERLCGTCAAPSCLPALSSKLRRELMPVPEASRPMRLGDLMSLPKVDISHLHDPPPLPASARTAMAYKLSALFQTSRQTLGSLTDTLGSKLGSLRGQLGGRGKALNAGRSKTCTAPACDP